MKRRTRPCLSKNVIIVARTSVHIARNALSGLLNQNIDLQVKLQGDTTENGSESILSEMATKIERLEQENFALRMIHVNDTKMINEKLKDSIPKDNIRAMIEETENLLHDPIANASYKVELLFTIRKLNKLLGGTIDE